MKRLEGRVALVTGAFVTGLELYIDGGYMAR